jgi:hypothetical protein
MAWIDSRTRRWCRPALAPTETHAAKMCARADETAGRQRPEREDAHVAGSAPAALVLCGKAGRRRTSANPGPDSM